MFPRPVLVESQRRTALPQAALGPFRFEVKRYIAQVSDVIDFVGVQLQRVRAVPSRNGAEERFAIAHLQESLDQLVCVKQSGIDPVISRGRERQHLSRSHAVTVMAEVGQQGQDMDQIVINPVGMAP